MANITAASGEITLRGNWSQEALDAFVPVLDMWGFYNGVYGIHSCDNFTLTHLTSDFSGCGRWSFSDTLSSFEELTREWIKEKLQDWNGEPHQLTEEQYELFLKIMCDNELRIGIAFEDQDPATEFCGREIGELSSDGKSIKYKVLWCAEMDFVEEFEDWADEAKREARERKRKEAKMKKLPFDNVSSVTISSKAFVLTGEFEGYEGEKREKVQEMIVAKGGRCTRSVSGKTDYVVIGALGDFGEKKIEDVKTQRAKGSGTKLIRQSDLFCALFGASNEKTIDAGKPQNSTGKSASNDAPCKYITVNGVPAEGRRVELLPGVTVQLP